MEPKKYAYIDSLRGLAILLVFLLHCGHMIGTPYFGETALKFIDNGKLGVLLFFTVSAYTLTLSMQSRTNEIHWVRNFFIRRFFRIAPLYWLALLFYTFTKVTGTHLLLTGHSANPVDPGKFFSNLFFVHGFRAEWINSYVPGGWSIADETTFYMLLPLLFIKIKDINSCISIFFIAVTACMILNKVFWFPFTEWETYIFFYFPSQFPVFLLGIMATFIARDGLKDLNNTSIALITAGIFAGCYYTPPYHILYSLFFMMLIVLLSKKSYRLFVNPVMAYLGKISYSLYITHFFILTVLGYFHVFNLLEETSVWTTLVNLLFRFLLTLGISVIISSITYHYIERKFELLGKNIIKKLSMKDISRNEN
jgi:peptidoglycan/LPS O-acetylase OafA/YrhL